MSSFKGTLFYATEISSAILSSSWLTTIATKRQVQAAITATITMTSILARPGMSVTFIQEATMIDIVDMKTMLPKWRMMKTQVETGKAAAMKKNATDH